MQKREGKNTTNEKQHTHLNPIAEKHHSKKAGPAKNTHTTHPIVNLETNSPGTLTWVATTDPYMHFAKYLVTAMEELTNKSWHSCLFNPGCGCIWGEGVGSWVGT